MSVRIILIEQTENNHKIATETAKVFDNGLVRLYRTVRDKLTGEESVTLNSALTIEQFKKLAEEL